jgi:F-type H+-transporting ATPase subunit a
LIFIFKTVWISPASIVFGVFMNAMELFVALMQAYIFTLLSAMYIGSAVEEHVHHGDEHGHGGATEYTEYDHGY